MRQSNVIYMVEAHSARVNLNNLTEPRPDTLIDNRSHQNDVETRERMFEVDH